MGSPVPVMRPYLPPAEDVLPYLRRMDQSRWYSNGGPLVHELETRYADYLGVEPQQVVAVANGTLGLMATVQSSEELEWICPAYTFAATPLALVQAGKRLRFRDVSSSSRMIELDKDFDGPSAILPVLPFGAPLRQAHWSVLQGRRVVFDAAASLGSCEGKLSDLPDRWAVVFSLHATKVLPAGGEGGLVVLGSRTWAREVRRWINFGFGGSRESLSVGLNGKLSEVSAAYGLASLDKAPREFAEWLDLRACTQQAPSSGVIPDRSVQQSPNPYWIVEFPTPQVASFAQSALLSHGFETRMWWRDCSTMPAFQGPSVSSERFPNAEWLSQTDVGLPFFRGMSRNVVEAIAALVASSIASFNEEDPN